MIKMKNGKDSIIFNISLIDLPIAFGKHIAAETINFANIAPKLYKSIMYKFGVTKSAVILVNGGSITLNDNEENFDLLNSEMVHPYLPVSIFKNRVILNEKAKRLEFYFDSKARLGNVLNVIEEVFVRKIYDTLDVNNRIVVDIGGNVGDTAIYFAMNGAKKVYVYEAVPKIFKILKKNVETNGFRNKVVAYNEAGGKGKSIVISAEEERAGQLMASQKGIKIRMASLDKITRRTGVTSGAVLKMDCEGAEYDLILNASTRTLHSYSQIMIEYHHGYKDLVKRLREEGFNVRYKRPIYMREGGGKRPELMMGLIWANREQVE
jgi:FkbM family methyltransferase